MKAVLSFVLFGMAFGKPDQNPYSALKMRDSWQQEITYDWDNLDHATAFEGWKQFFGKTYGDIEEEAHRFLVFLDNWSFINKHNVEGKHNYTLRMNQFGDLRGDEFRYYVHGKTGSCLQKRTVDQRVKMHPRSSKKMLKDLPTSIDWTNINGKSYVTAVKNQGQCGSCWAFSTTGSIESRTAIKTQTTGADIVTLSEQQLVDCSSAEGNDGCNGGLMDNAFKYVESFGGLCSVAEYKYEARGGKCKASSCQTIYDDITSYTDVKADNMLSLETAVAEGPVSIAIEADQSAFQFYSGGVLDGNCGDRLDHGVLVVGYGTEKGSDFWKVKNSWGSSWGEDGYVKICRNCDKNGNKGECGILMQPSYPIPK